MVIITKDDKICCKMEDPGSVAAGRFPALLSDLSLCFSILPAYEIWSSVILASSKKLDIKINTPEVFENITK